MLMLLIANILLNDDFNKSEIIFIFIYLFGCAES